MAEKKKGEGATTPTKKKQVPARGSFIHELGTPAPTRASNKKKPPPLENANATKGHCDSSSKQPQNTPSTTQVSGGGAAAAAFLRQSSWDALTYNPVNPAPMVPFLESTFAPSSSAAINTTNQLLQELEPRPLLPIQQQLQDQGRDTQSRQPPPPIFDGSTRASGATTTPENSSSSQINFLQQQLKQLQGQMQQPRAATTTQFADTFPHDSFSSTPTTGTTNVLSGIVSGLGLSTTASGLPQFAADQGSALAQPQQHLPSIASLLSNDTNSGFVFPPVEQQQKMAPTMLEPRRLSLGFGFDAMGGVGLGGLTTPTTTTTNRSDDASTNAAGILPLDIANASFFYPGRSPTSLAFQAVQQQQLQQLQLQQLRRLQQNQLAPNRGTDGIDGPPDPGQSQQQQRPSYF